jgi:hypothetical protein
LGWVCFRGLQKCIDVLGMYWRDYRFGLVQLGHLSRSIRLSGKNHGSFENRLMRIDSPFRHGTEEWLGAYASTQWMSGTGSVQTRLRSES